MKITEQVNLSMNIKYYKPNNSKIKNERQTEIDREN